MKSVLVVGMGLSGRSAAHFLLRHGRSVIGYDESEAVFDLPDCRSLRDAGVVCTSNAVIALQANIDMIVASPGIPITHPLLLQLQNRGIPVIGELELAATHLQNRCIGITGTNGKTTTCLLVEHLLKSQGIDARAVGNIGLPLTNEIDRVNTKTVLVIELSSFQLETMKCRFLDCAAILNLTPDHLDRHDNMENYAQAKANISRLLKPACPLFVNKTAIAAVKPFLDENAASFTYSTSKSADVYSDGIQLYDHLGHSLMLPKACINVENHDVENMIAAYAICSYLTEKRSHFAQAADNFIKPPHRVEYVTTIEGVKYFNDSKGTNIDAVSRAVDMMEGPVVLLGGGKDKGLCFSEWKQKFSGKVKRIYAIGETAKKIKEELSDSLEVAICPSLEEAVLQAASIAQTGENILLSPGCSSFDMFKDYADRGDHFKRVVGMLSKSRS